MLRYIKTVTIFTLAVALFGASQSMAAEVHGVMMVVKGDIKVTSAKTQKTDQAKIGMKVFPGDAIQASADSRAKIVMSDKNVLNISPDSKIVIAQYQNDGNNKNVQIDVMYGKVRADVQQKYDGDKSQFNVKTPSAVAGVRGTVFLTEHRQKSGSNFSVESGSIAVVTRRGIMNITAGQGLNINSTGEVKKFDFDPAKSNESDDGGAQNSQDKSANGNGAENGNKNEGQGNNNPEQSPSGQQATNGEPSPNQGPAPTEGSQPAPQPGQNPPPAPEGGMVGQPPPPGPMDGGGMMGDSRSPSSTMPPPPGGSMTMTTDFGGGLSKDMNFGTANPLPGTQLPATGDFSKYTDTSKLCPTCAGALQGSGNTKVIINITTSP